MLVALSIPHHFLVVVVLYFQLLQSQCLKLILYLLHLSCLLFLFNNNKLTADFQAVLSFHFSVEIEYTPLDFFVSERVIFILISQALSRFVSVINT